MADAPEWWASASDVLVKRQEQSMEKLLVPIRKDVETIKGDVGKLQTLHASLDQRVAALEMGTSAGSDFKPTYVEIRGLCEFANSVCRFWEGM